MIPDLRRPGLVEGRSAGWALILVGDEPGERVRGERRTERERQAGGLRGGGGVVPVLKELRDLILWKGFEPPSWSALCDACAN